MMHSAEIDLPVPVREELRQRAAFGQSFLRFARDNVAGFQQPVAAAAAIIAPILVAFTYALGGLFSLLEVSITFGVTTLLFLGGAWFAKRHDIAWAYAQGVESRQLAHDDLKLGRGFSYSLKLRKVPLFVEHEHGVVVFADTEEGRTLFLDIDGTGADPRWFLYVNGDLYRRNWQWLRLKSSGIVAQFSAGGAQITAPGEPQFTRAKDAFDAISLALGEPHDGDLIDLPFSEAEQTVKRLL